MYKFASYLCCLLLIVLLDGCHMRVKDFNQIPEKVSSQQLPHKILKTKMGTNIPVYSFDAFKFNILDINEPSITYVINFWATWCGPCVAELPYFLEAEQQYSGKNVKFIYVSLDFVKDLETKLIPFLEKRDLRNKVVVLDQKDVNSWMNKIDKKWSGAIPATLIFNSEKRLFIEDNFENVSDLDKTIREFIR